MTDAQIAEKAVKNAVRSFTIQAESSLQQIYGLIGGAKSPKDTQQIADGRETIIAKLGDQSSSLTSLENVLKDLAAWVK